MHDGGALGTRGPQPHSKSAFSLSLPYAAMIELSIVLALLAFAIGMAALHEHRNDNRRDAALLAGIGSTLGLGAAVAAAV